MVYSMRVTQRSNSNRLNRVRPDAIFAILETSWLVADIGRIIPERQRLRIANRRPDPDLGFPRAWLASGAQVLSDEQMLSVIRTGKLPDGNTWDPRQTALIESAVDFQSPAAADPAARAEVTRHDPNRVNVKTTSSTASILILGDNHYPGWRTYVDGRAVETLRVDYNLCGVPFGGRRASGRVPLPAKIGADRTADFAAHSGADRPAHSPDTCTNNCIKKSLTFCFSLLRLLRNKRFREIIGWLPRAAL
jgi:hypothetical protein